MAVETLFSDDLMAKFYAKHFQKLLDYTTSAFGKAIDQVSSLGKRALKIMEIGVGKLQACSPIQCINPS